MSRVIGDRLLLPYDGTGAHLPEGLTLSAIDAVCAEQGLSFGALAPVQKFFLTHYRCSFCKMLPLALLDLTRPTRARCGRCGQLVTFSGAGKYGKMRKKLAQMIWASRSREEKYGIS